MPTSRTLRTPGLLFLALYCGVPATQAEESQPKPQTIRTAVGKSLVLLEKGSAGSAKHRQCFTCHNQALPVLAFVEARRRGFTINEDNFNRQLQHTAAALKRRKANFLRGRGKTIIDAYALWTLEAGGWSPDETTAAAARFLLKTQRKRGHWRNSSRRPPSIGSDFTTTYVAVRGLKAFGTSDQKEQIEARIKIVRKWLLRTPPRDTEDSVFRLRLLAYLNVDQKTVGKATQHLLNLQRKDGGWAQKSDMTSDAYATGTVLVALHQAGGLPVKNRAYQRGIRFLLRNQSKDGSWHVKTRAEPFQTYFESGFPHGKDQFISIAASSWATFALLLDLPLVDNSPSPRQKKAVSARQQNSHSRSSSHEFLPAPVPLALAGPLLNSSTHILSGLSWSYPGQGCSLGGSFTESSPEHQTNAIP